MGSHRRRVAVALTVMGLSCGVAAGVVAATQ